MAASTGGRGQPPQGSPITTAASNYEMHKGNSEAFNNALAAVTGDNSSSPPDYAATQMVSGNITGGRHGGAPGGAFKTISPEMMQAGVVAQVRDSYFRHLEQCGNEDGLQTGGEFFKTGRRHCRNSPVRWRRGSTVPVKERHLRQEQLLTDINSAISPAAAQMWQGSDGEML